ncbi:hypothetical protein [Lederbergia citrea]|uniref:hypothetical protein n=1 Tax=Lederbergia citrea TaxID=2833581 RepID=UPI001BC9D810|nr:hypothetical protein [Lederbergia citrea]MBS4202884.1 hypothetical protein [Lederbergia citrea]
MKTVVALFVITIVMYSIYYDLTIGTLPTSSAALVFSKDEWVSPMPSEFKEDWDIPSDPYTLIEIKRGDTVISILEELQQAPLPVSIDQLLIDFKKLNEGIKPEQIQIGKRYKFPIYQ